MYRKKKKKPKPKHLTTEDAAFTECRNKAEVWHKGFGALIHWLKKYAGLPSVVTDRRKLRVGGSQATLTDYSNSERIKCRSEKQRMIFRT